MIIIIIIIIIIVSLITVTSTSTTQVNKSEPKAYYGASGCHYTAHV